MQINNIKPLAIKLKPITKSYDISVHSKYILGNILKHARKHAFKVTNLCINDFEHIWVEYENHKNNIRAWEKKRLDKDVTAENLKYVFLELYWALKKEYDVETYPLVNHDFETDDGKYIFRWQSWVSEANLKDGILIAVRVIAKRGIDIPVPFWAPLAATEDDKHNKPITTNYPVKWDTTSSNRDKKIIDKIWRLVNLVKNLVYGDTLGKSIIVAGATNSGKTTFVNDVLLSEFPKSARVISVEDVYEIDTARFENSVRIKLDRKVDSKSKITYVDAIDCIMRARPDVVICGEISVDNVNPILRLMGTGHITITTVHADDATLRTIASAFANNLRTAGREADEASIRYCLQKCAAIIYLDANRTVSQIYFNEELQAIGDKQLLAM